MKNIECKKIVKIIINSLKQMIESKLQTTLQLKYISTSHLNFQIKKNWFKKYLDYYIIVLFYFSLKLLM